MRRRLAFIVTTIAVLAVPVGAAHAAFFKADAIDGPSADIRSVGDMDIARDGTGAVAYVKADGGVNHIFVSRLVGGAWQAPERVDGGLDAAGSTPVGRRLRRRPAGRRLRQRRQRLRDRAPGRRAGVERAAADRPGRRRPGRSTCRSTAARTRPSRSTATCVGARHGPHGRDVRRPHRRRWTTTRATPRASAPAARSVAVSADGTGVVVWGEAGHVYARRIFNTSAVDRGARPQPRRPRGPSGRHGRPPERRHRGRLVVRVGRVPRAVRQRRQRAARSACGCAARAPTRRSPSTASAGAARPPRPPRDRHQRQGRQGVATAGASNGSALSAILKDDILNPARAIGGSGRSTQPVGAVAETTDRAVGWFNAGDQTIQGVVLRRQVARRGWCPARRRRRRR